MPFGTMELPPWMLRHRLSAISHHHVILQSLVNEFSDELNDALNEVLK